MSLPHGPSEPRPAPEDAQPAPFAAVTVTLTKQEHIQLVMDVSYWRTQFERRVARQARRDQEYRRLFDRLEAQFAQRKAQLIAELKVARAKVRDLQRRVFGRKSERSKGASERRGQTISKSSRGQLSVSLQPAAFDPPCCHRPTDNTAGSPRLKAEALTHMVLLGHGGRAGPFDPFIWHSLAFDPFNLSPPSNQRAI